METIVTMSQKYIVRHKTNAGLDAAVRCMKDYKQSVEGFTTQSGSASYKAIGTPFVSLTAKHEATE